MHCPFCPKQDHRFPKVGAATHSVPLCLVPEVILTASQTRGAPWLSAADRWGGHRPSPPVSLSLLQLERPPGHLQGETARGTYSGEQETACGHFSGVTRALEREARRGLRAQRVKRIHHGKPYQKEDQPGTPAGAQTALLQRFKGKTILKGTHGCRAGGRGRWGRPTPPVRALRHQSPATQPLGAPCALSLEFFTRNGNTWNRQESKKAQHSPWEEAAVSPEGKHTQTA